MGGTAASRFSMKTCRRPLAADAPPEYSRLTSTYENGPLGDVEKSLLTLLKKDRRTVPQLLEHSVSNHLRILGIKNQVSPLPIQGMRAIALTTCLAGAPWSDTGKINAIKRMCTVHIHPLNIHLNALVRLLQVENHGPDSFSLAIADAVIVILRSMDIPISPKIHIFEKKSVYFIVQAVLTQDNISRIPASKVVATLAQVLSHVAVPHAD